MSCEPSVATGLIGNVYDKYGTANPIERALMRGFLGAVTDLYARAAPTSALEVGCGEGMLAQHLMTQAPRPRRFAICDVDLGAISPRVDPRIERHQASIYALPFADASFDLVLCCEVLEHLVDPQRGLAEVTRVARRFVVLSTPREPLWRLLNIARGRYWRAFGNTPGHVQHFDRRSLQRLASRNVHVLERRCPTPWVVLLGEPLRRTPAHCPPESSR